MKTSLTKSKGNPCYLPERKTITADKPLQRWLTIAMACLLVSLGWPTQVQAQEVYTINVPQSEGKTPLVLDYNNMVNAVGFEITAPSGVKITQKDAYKISVDMNGKATGLLAEHITEGSGAGQIIFDLSADGINPLSPGIYDFSIRMESADNCFSDPIAFKVAVKALPELTLMPDEVFCQETDLNITGSITTISGAIFKYTWVAEVMGTDEEKLKIVTANGYQSVGEVEYNTGINIAENIANTNKKPIVIKYTVTPIAYYGSFRVAGKPKSVNITLNPRLDLTLPADPVVLCNGATTSISLSSSLTGGTANQVEWTKTLTDGSIPGLSSAPSGKHNLPAIIAETFVNDGVAPAVVKYTITQTYTNSKECMLSESMEVIVNPAPLVNNIASQTICEGSAATVELATANTGTEVKYKITVTGGENVEGETGTVTDVASGNWSTGSLTLTAGTTTPQVLTYTVTPKIGECEGTPVTFTVTVNPSLIINVDKASDVICTGNTSVVKLTSGVSGVDVLYTITAEMNANIGGIPAQAITVTSTNGAALDWTTPALTNTTGDLQTAKFTITPSIAGECAGTPVVFEVVVVPAITLGDIDAQSPICSKEGVAAINFEAPGLGTSVTDHIVYSWSFSFNSAELDVVAPAGVEIKDSGVSPLDKIATGTGEFSITSLTNKQTAQKSVVVTVQARYNQMDCAVSAEKTFTVTINPQPSFKLGK